ncbi:hypothetical protein GQ43DRAFT_428173 [Delitschia confertaspora ATCC 74209]|uniref:Uncharacterized protein n=1 Tax=Delitschia confertaspora ATCC 74209 TaxID=1513339 RepID=A0A9P4MTK5_9PLEO|nr:hypothetical protein GQ43DRAFT_428173 [Delitschia confertaspora ATCC 74209]
MTGIFIPISAKKPPMVCPPFGKAPWVKLQPGPHIYLEIMPALKTIDKAVKGIPPTYVQGQFGYVLVKIDGLIKTAPFGTSKRKVHPKTNWNEYIGMIHSDHRNADKHTAGKASLEMDVPAYRSGQWVRVNEINSTQNVSIIVKNSAYSLEEYDISAMNKPTVVSFQPLRIAHNE